MGKPWYVWDVGFLHDKSPLELFPTTTNNGYDVKVNIRAVSWGWGNFQAKPIKMYSNYSTGPAYSIYVARYEATLH